MKHVQTGMCINATNKIQVNAQWGKTFAVELSNNCLDPAVQFRFLDNSAMFNLERKSCFEGKSSVLYFLLAKDTSQNCRDRDHAITQTSWRGLSVYDLYYKQTRCAVPKTNTYIGLTTCSDAEDKRFNFGNLFLFVCSMYLFDVFAHKKFLFLVLQSVFHIYLNFSSTIAAKLA